MGGWRGFQSLGRGRMPPLLVCEESRFILLGTGGRTPAVFPVTGPPGVHAFGGVGPCAGAGVWFVFVLWFCLFGAGARSLMRSE